MAGLNALTQRLERMAGAELKERIAKKVRDALHAEAVRGFREQRDPYGSTWAPRKRGGYWPLLDKTGAGLNSLVGSASGSRVMLRIVNFYKFHESGTRYMPARKIFPDPARGLGTWEEPAHRAAVEAVLELMR